MRTDKQRAASRANGAKSSGPATPEGKTISSQNALKHGLHAEAHCIRGEDPAEFGALVDHYHRTFHPTGADQHALVTTLIRTEWLLNRLQRLEIKLWDREMAEAAEYDSDDPFSLAAIRGSDTFKLLQRRLDSANRTYLRTRQLLLRLQKQPPLPQPADPKPETPVVGSFPHPAPSEPPSRSEEPPALAP